MGKIQDLTIIYITANLVPERWQKFQIEILLEAIDKTSIISVSRKPLDLGYNIIDFEPKSYWNIYVQLNQAAKLATTDYIAIVEDDTLYTHEHFVGFRPKLDEVSYNRSRWSLFVWDPLYCLRQRISNCSLIAARKYLIDALDEREKRWPEGCSDHLVGEVGRPVIDRRMKVSARKMVEWYCRNPIVQFNHENGTDNGDYGLKNGKHLIKKHGQIQAYDIPYWGKAEELVKRFINEII